MPEANDIELLAQFARENSETAFAALVERHVRLVYSVALRHIGSPHAAEEITQAVFIVLARKAKRLSAKTILSGWLHQTARLTAANYLRAEIRRRHHEQEAHVQSILTESANDETWRQFAPHLDEAIGRLRNKDRDALILRYFENKSLREVGDAMGLQERTAQKRVNRAVEKLRNYFSKRGIALTTAIIADVISANSVQAAPIGLASTITATIAKGSAVAASTLTLVKVTMKMMTWMKLKFALGVSMAVLLAGGAATVAISQTSSDDKLTPQEIIEKSQDTYASLSSYSDEGKTVSTIGSTTVAPTTFTIKLARPNLYRIEWQQNNGFLDQKGVVWSAGYGDFLKIGDREPVKSSDKESALAGATGISGGAAASIPGTFFKMNWGNQLGASIQSAKRKNDEKIGDTDCYVLTQEKGGLTRTLWIGKQDFLIHQLENDTSAAFMKAEVEKAAKKNPEMQLRPSVAGDRKFIETHMNISMNQKFSASDFIP
jgi:RNA polymerase sigma factor (sigma-70 family)